VKYLNRGHIAAPPTLTALGATLEKRQRRSRAWTRTEMVAEDSEAPGGESAGERNAKTAKPQPAGTRDASGQRGLYSGVEGPVNED
jgi:hypothetical protein